MTNLKHCPFCGHDTLCITEKGVMSLKFCYVSCGNCGAQGPYLEAINAFATGFISDSKKAVETWNKRHDKKFERKEKSFEETHKEWQKYFDEIIVKDEL